MTRMRKLMVLMGAALVLSVCSGDDGKLYLGPCMTFTDFENDGVVDSVTRSTYNAAGHLLTREWAFHSDGVVDTRETRTYNANGDLLTVEQDEDADGVVDFSEVYAYGAQNQRTSFEAWQGQNLICRETYTYHANGELASQRNDRDGTGVWDYESLFDAEGLLIQWGWDSDGDDVADKGRQYEYGPGGLQQLQTLYQGNLFGEQPNSETTYLYDSEGYLLSVETFNYLQDQVTYLETHEWNSDHTVEDTTYFHNPNDLPFAGEHTEYDLNGNRTHYAQDWDSDGLDDSVTTWTWDGELLLETMLDAEGDGVWDSRTTYQYNAQGLVTETCDYSAPVDGEPRWVNTVEYDKHGNETRRTLVFMGGVPSVTTHDYSCW